MMSSAFRGLWQRPWLTLAGGLLGVLLAPTISYSVGVLTDLYYSIAPVSQLSGDVLRADGQEIVVHLRANKRYAPSCQFLLLRARTIDAGQEFERAIIERIDKPLTGDKLPAGKHDIGIYRIVPRSDGVAVMISPMYECGGQVVWGGSVMLPLSTDKPSAPT